MARICSASTTPDSRTNPLESRRSLQMAVSHLEVIRRAPFAADYERIDGKLHFAVDRRDRRGRRLSHAAGLDGGDVRLAVGCPAPARADGPGSAPGAWSRWPTPAGTNKRGFSAQRDPRVSPPV